jgi:hypothetical protein
MSKAEDRYLELFQDGRLRNCSSKKAFLLGYHQAEKDLALTWEDIREIYCITLNLREHLGASVFGEPLYQEVLKRFRDFKERKEK